MTNLPENLRAALDRRPGLRAALAARLGVTVRTVDNYANGTRRPGPAQILEIASVLGTTTDELLGASGTSASRREPRSVELLGEDYTTIALLNVLASAGPGTTVDVAEEVERIAFRRDWLARIDVAPQNAALVTARGHSMEPLIWDGDLVMIDMSQTEPAQRPMGRPGRRGPRDEIFVLDQAGETRLKAVRRNAKDQIILYSENANVFQPELYAGPDLAELRFIGKVVWWAHAEGR